MKNKKNIIKFITKYMLAIIMVNILSSTPLLCMKNKKASKIQKQKIRKILNKKKEEEKSRISKKRKNRIIGTICTIGTSILSIPIISYFYGKKEKVKQPLNINNKPEDPTSPPNADLLTNETLNTKNITEIKDVTAQDNAKKQNPKTKSNITTQETSKKAQVKVVSRWKSLGKKALIIGAATIIAVPLIIIFEKKCKLFKKLFKKIIKNKTTKKTGWLQKLNKWNNISLEQKKQQNMLLI